MQFSSALAGSCCRRLPEQAAKTDVCCEASFRAKQVGPGVIQVVPAIAFQPLSLGIGQVQNAVAFGANHFRS